MSHGPASKSELNQSIWQGELHIWQCSCFDQLQQSYQAIYAACAFLWHSLAASEKGTDITIGLPSRFVEIMLVRLPLAAHGGVTPGPATA